MKKIRRYALDFLICFMQINTHIFLGLLLRRFSRPCGLPKDIDKLKRGTLLVSNHQTIFDPFLILVHIPFAVFIKIIPVRFPTCRKVINKKYLFLLLKIYGCYDIGENGRERMLGFFYTRKLLQEGKTIFLFPEGKLCKTDEIGEFNKGINFFISAAKNVFFIKIIGFHKVRWFNFFIKKPALKFGEVKSFQDENINAHGADLKEVLENI